MVAQDLEINDESEKIDNEDVSYNDSYERRV